jgi:hypothetical protein
VGRELGEEVPHGTTDADQSTEFHEVVDLRRHSRSAVEEQSLEGLLGGLFAVEDGDLVVAVCMIALRDPKVALGLRPPQLRFRS